MRDGGGDAAGAVVVGGSGIDGGVGKGEVGEAFAGARRCGVGKDWFGRGGLGGSERGQQRCSNNDEGGSQHKDIMLVEWIFG